MRTYRFDSNQVIASIKHTASQAQVDFKKSLVLDDITEVQL